MDNIYNQSKWYLIGAISAIGIGIVLNFIPRNGFSAAIILISFITIFVLMLIYSILTSGIKIKDRTIIMPGLPHQKIPFEAVQKIYVAKLPTDPRSKKAESNLVQFASGGVNVSNPSFPDYDEKSSLDLVKKLSQENIWLDTQTGKGLRSYSLSLQAEMGRMHINGGIPVLSDRLREVLKKLMAELPKDKIDESVRKMMEERS